MFMVARRSFNASHVIYSFFRCRYDYKTRKSHILCNPRISDTVEQIVMETNQSSQTEMRSSAEPISLFDLLSREGSSITILPRINVRGSAVAAGRAPAVPPPPSPPSKRFLTISIPNSPNPTSLVVNKKKHGRNQASSPPSDAVAGEAKQEIRASSRPSIEYEVCLRRVHNVDHHGSRQFEASFRKRTEAAGIAADKGYWGFTCGALCVYLPAFFKGKPLTKKEAVDIQSMISRTMSREKFECGSWSAAAIVSNNEEMNESHSSEEDDNDGDGDGVDRLSMNLYYELPLEMMESGNKVEQNDAKFEKHELKGILLTNSLLKERKSNLKSSGRHVRFSTETPIIFPSSPPSCITPRLRLARDEFNAFLEAQNV